MGENTSLISILMPTYNVAPYVKEAVDSILKQSYQNIELIIVDDCSTDGTYEILKSMEPLDSRIKLYRNDKNCKICKTLNRALSYAQGKYIGRMDGDDISEPERFEILKNYLDEHREIALAGSYLISIDEKGREFSRKKYPCTPKAIEMGNTFMSCVSHIWLARYEVYSTLNGYREVPYVEDYDFLLRGELKGYKYANVDAYLYRCRIRTGNTGSTNGLRQRKAVGYVQQLHKDEKRTGKDCFSHDEYLQAINIDEAENKEYIKAADKLNVAVRSKRRPLRLLYYTASAMIQSKYVARYIMDALRFRILLLWEKA